jgi:hypothetical protein
MSSTNPTGSLRAFFEAFETSSARADAARLASMYAPTLTVLGPAGTQIVSREDLMRAIPKRQQLFDAAGWRRTRLAAFDESSLDARYVLARTEWQWTFARGAETIDLALPSSFVVDRRDPAAPQIVVYLMHHDLTTALRERGLLAAPMG